MDCLSGKSLLFGAMLIKRRYGVSRRRDGCFGVPKMLEEVVHGLALRVDDCG
jgi:hypothetical protein